MYGSPHSVSTWAGLHRENLLRRGRNRFVLSACGLAALIGGLSFVAALIERM
jgi:hypothetical protein